MLGFDLVAVRRRRTEYMRGFRHGVVPFAVTKEIRQNHHPCTWAGVPPPIVSQLHRFYLNPPQVGTDCLSSPRLRASPPLRQWPPTISFSMISLCYRLRVLDP